MGSKSIVKAKEYKVKDGDSIESIAKAHGMTWQELSRFNWGTDKPDEINKHLRSDVGCFKRTENDKSFVFTGKDDPGLVYIPEKFPDKQYSSNSLHAITVKQIVRKTFIPSKVMVHFRPKADWKGEYGFDWLRIKKDVLVTETDYETAINGGYDGTDAGMSAADAFKQLRTEYGYDGFKTAVKDETVYFVPYLRLYPKGTPGKVTPPFEAELRMRITVEDEEPLGIEFSYNKNLFKLSKEVIDDKAIAKKKAIAGTIKITCLDAFDTDQEINVLAYPKTWQVTDPIPIAGKIIVGANSKKRRIPVKFIFVKVKTDILNTGVANTGTYGSLTVNGLTEINNLDNTLFQCFFDQEAVFAPDLDLTANKDLKAPDPKDPTLGKYIDPVTNSINFGAPGFRSGLRTLFLQVKDGSGKLINAKYSDAKIFTVFSFNEPAVKNVIGAIEAIGTRNLVLFSSRDTTTLNHEVLHGFGLRHTHKESSAGYKVLSESKYTYPNALNDKVNCTDNVMSYNDKGWTTWNWQWTLLRSINQ